MTSSVQELLKTPVSHIVAEQKLVFIDSKAPVPKALNVRFFNCNLSQILIDIGKKQHLQCTRYSFEFAQRTHASSLVYDEQKKEWKGFIDLCDIVTYIVHIIDAQVTEHSIGFHSVLKATFRKNKTKDNPINTQMQIFTHCWNKFKDLISLMQIEL
jgi:hypothetical protein